MLTQSSEQNFSLITRLRKEGISKGGISNKAHETQKCNRFVEVKMHPKSKMANMSWAGINQQWQHNQKDAWKSPWP